MNPAPGLSLATGLSFTQPLREKCALQCGSVVEFSLLVKAKLAYYVQQKIIIIARLSSIGWEKRLFRVAIMRACMTLFRNSNNTCI